MLTVNAIYNMDNIGYLFLLIIDRYGSGNCSAQKTPAPSDDGTGVLRNAVGN